MPFWQKKFEDLYRPYRIFTFLVLFCLLGVMMASFFNLNFSHVWPVLIWATSLLFLSAFCNFCLKNNFLVLLSIAIAGLFLGLTYYAWFDQAHNFAINFSQSAEIEGLIVTRPQIDYKSQKVTIEAIDPATAKKYRVLATLSRFPEYHVGDRLRVSGALSEPQNFSDFDYQGYLKRYFVLGLVNQPKNVMFLGTDSRLYLRFMRGLYNFSQMFEDNLNSILPEPHASLAAGILLGVKRNIPDNLMNQLNATGLTHIIALSGYNVTIIITVFSGLFLVRWGRKRILLVGSILVLLFVLMTGASSSVIRAAIFSLLILFGGILGRKADQTNLMLLAAFLMVLANPYVLRYDSGFQLSFLAFAGLIYLAPVLEKFLQRMKSKYLSDSVRFVLAETLGAQIAVLPLIWFQFGRVSIIAPVANLLVVPVIPLAMGLIFLAGALGFIGGIANQIGLVLLWPILQYIILAVGILSRIPLASINTK